MAYLTNEPILVEGRGLHPRHPGLRRQRPAAHRRDVHRPQDTIDNKRDMLKAFLKAEIQGWTDAVADPAGAAKLAVDTYGKDLSSTSRADGARRGAERTLIVTDDTKANGLFTMTDDLIARTSRRWRDGHRRHGRAAVRPDPAQ